jgi:diacylglycerol kinase family enzyme
MNARLVLNPASRNGRGRRHWAFWREGLRRAGVSFEAVATRSLDHARDLARSATGFDTVVAVGGDGTINAVLAGLSDAAVPGQRMAVLYAGTRPDFCRFHGIPVEPVAALAGLLGGRARRVDAVAIRHATQDGTAAGWFGCSCSVGMGAAVAVASNRWRRYVGDAAGTALAVLGAIARSRPLDLEVEIDGLPVVLPQTRHLVILKNPWIASGLRLNVDRTPDDGRLSVFAITGRSRAGLCALLPAFYTGSATRSGGVFLREGRTVRVRSGVGCGVEFDGDPHGSLPLEVAVSPGRLELVSA